MSCFEPQFLKNMLKETQKMLSKKRKTEFLACVTSCHCYLLFSGSVLRRLGLLLPAGELLFPEPRRSDAGSENHLLLGLRVFGNAMEMCLAPRHKLIWEIRKTSELFEYIVGFIKSDQLMDNRLVIHDEIKELRIENQRAPA